MIEINMQMPEKCGLCPCFHFENPMYCQAVKADKNKKIVNPYGSPRPEWCPLKEQEPKPVKVETRRVLDGETDDGPIYIMDTFYRCPSCGSVFSRTNKNFDIHYCKHCGQAVKWE